MSGKEDAKAQEHSKQQVRVIGDGFTGAYNVGILYQPWNFMGLMT
jgi:hypothetical protein